MEEHRISGWKSEFLREFLPLLGIPVFQTRKENLLLTLEAEIDRNVPLVAEVTLNGDGRWPEVLPVMKAKVT